MDSAPRTTDKPVPLGLALGVMGILVIGGGLMIGKYVYRSNKPNAMRVITPPPSNPRVAGGLPNASPATILAVAKAGAEADLPDGVHAGEGGATLFKSGDTYFRAIETKDQPRYSFGFFTFAELEWEHGYLTQGVRRILAEEEFAAELGITDDQRTRLKELPTEPPSKWPLADREKFIALYQKWKKARGDEQTKAGEEVIKTLKTYGEKRRAESQKLMGERTAKIRAILTEQQVARINPEPRVAVKPENRGK